MNHKRILYGGILLDEEKLRTNNIFHNIEVEYYKLTNDKMSLFKGRDNKKTYGIEVIMREYINGEVKTENEKIEVLTKNEEIVDKVLEVLKNNEVTPTTVKDVIEDLFN